MLDLPRLVGCEVVLLVKKSKSSSEAGISYGPRSCWALPVFGGRSAGWVRGRDIRDVPDLRGMGCPIELRPGGKALPWDCIMTGVPHAADGSPEEVGWSSPRWWACNAWDGARDVPAPAAPRRCPIFCSSDAMRVLRRCPMRSSLKRQLRLLLSKSSTGCRRLHCWQKRSCSPSCMTTGALAWKSQMRYRKLRVFILATDSLQPWTLHIGSFLFFRGLRVFAPGCSAAAGTGGGNGFGGPVSAFLVVRAGAVVPRALRRRLAVTGFSSILAVLDLAGGCGDCGGDCCGGSPERGLSSAVKSPEPIAEFVYYISARGRYGSTPRPAGARLRRNDPSTLLAGVLKAVAASEIIFAAVVVARSSDHCLGSLRASCPARRAFNS
mmetsp:Transcript_47864/g.119848  ORF Transcript_47864/g.119848 Transcript_47864/m.119848 type:complete len:380 (-) Transcript_47864:138-1277(-)